MIAAYFNPYRLRVGILLIAVLVTAVAGPTHRQRSNKKKKTTDIRSGNLGYKAGATA